MAVGGIFATILVGLFLYAKINGSAGTDSGGGTGQPVASVRCDNSEQLAYHSHVHLDILRPDGQPVVIPASIGIQSTCLYWIHTHDTSGIVHIEAPASMKGHTFTLGDFFQIWGQPLDSTHVSTFTAGKGQKVVAFVNGNPYTKDLRSIPLTAHAEITLEITPPQVEPAKSYDFPSGF